MFLRQMDIFNPAEFVLPVHIIGVGGIGSPVAILLAKMGIHDLHLYDADTVSEHNIPNQMYRTRDMSHDKASALAEIIGEFTTAQTTANAVEYTNQRLTGIVISAVDSMAVRQAIWERVEYKLSISLYIEARMGGQVGEVYALRTTDSRLNAWYRTSLYTDEEAVEEACTARAIIYNTWMIASIIGSIVRNFAVGNKHPKHVILDASNLLVLKEE